MKFLVIELGAVDELISNRVLQSVEFEQGNTLATLLTGQTPNAILSPLVSLTRLSDGVFLTLQNIAADAKFLVIDIEQSAIFKSQTEANCLFILQKLMRFSKKIWQGMSLNFAERLFSGTSKAVLFPFSGYQQSPFRIAIDRDPWSERLSKRGHTGSFLLAYKAGRESGEAAKETADLGNFRKAYESLGELRKKLQQQAKDAVAPLPQIDQLQVASLDEVQNGTNSLYRPYASWLNLLTTQQKKFVSTPISGPYRVEGPAGTGKTLCLMLKAINVLHNAKKVQAEAHIVFVTHSDATKRAIIDALTVIDAERFSERDRRVDNQTLKVRTLSELCAEELRQSISEAEFIDRDAMESKGLQLLYLDEVLDRALTDELPSHARFLSANFLSFLRTEQRWSLAEMLQHEISVVVKGRASEDLGRYKKLTPLKYGLPISSDADKGFVFTLFRAYQEKLGQFGQFDTDDVVLTAIGQLDTPIWRRRRKREGYDSVFIDESHLFNINELHLFHYFTKAEGPYPIIYSVDRSQAVGDKGWTSNDIAQTLTNSPEGAGIGQEARIKTVFRSSPDIVNLAFSVVSAGATLFTNFDNPMDTAASSFTEEEERRSSPPQYISVPNEEALVEQAFLRAENTQKEIGCRRSDVLIVTLTDKVLDLLADFAVEKNKAHLLIKKRGDAQAVEAAKSSGQFVLAHADYVGGLQFAAVILVGIDEGRIPPVRDDLNESSRNYLSYASHNRLYVAVSRAKYRVEILGEKSRGPSRILLPAIASGLLKSVDLK